MKKKKKKKRIVDYDEGFTFYPSSDTVTLNKDFEHINTTKYNILCSEIHLLIWDMKNCKIILKF